MDDRQQRLFTMAGLAVAVAGHRGVGQGQRPAWMPEVHGLVGEGAQDMTTERSVSRFRRDAGGNGEVALSSAVFTGVEGHPTGEVSHLRHGGVRVAAKLICTESAAKQRYRTVEQVAGKGFAAGCAASLLVARGVVDREVADVVDVGLSHRARGGRSAVRRCSGGGCPPRGGGQGKAGRGVGSTGYIRRWAMADRDRRSRWRTGGEAGPMLAAQGLARAGLMGEGLRETRQQ